MSHSLGIPLKNVTAASGPQDYHLLLRVVQVVGLDEQKLSLPAREIWAGRTSHDDQIEYLIMQANSVYDDHEESATLEEANDLLSGPLALLPSLVHSMPYSGSFRWCTTKRVTAEPCIWERKVREGTGDVYYIIDETNLSVWLDAGAGSAQEFYDEEDWTCASCPDTDEEESGLADSDEEVEEDVDTEDVEETEEAVGSDGDDVATQDQETLANATLPDLTNDRWAKDTDKGYEGEVEQCEATKTA